MPGKRLLLHTAALFLLPIIVAAFGLSVWSAIGLVLLLLLWRWLISLSTFVLPEKAPDIVLDSIAVSHFVEKVRWNMDRAGIEYTENVSGGTLGAFFAGRTVPRLRFRTGAVRSEIGNSAEILRYLWGAYAGRDEEKTRHLAPTPERLELEARLDRYGRNLQVWIYSHILDDRELTLRLWGADSDSTPRWQCFLLKQLFPLQRLLIRRSFRITPEHVASSREHINDLLAEMDATLSDGRASILGGGDLNYTDFTFAAFTAVWLMPPAYGGGIADNVMIERDRMPEAAREEIAAWCKTYPTMVGWVEQLYEKERKN